MTSPAEPEGRLLREAVGVFQDAEALEAAVDSLLSQGFDRAEISLLAGERAVEAKLGAHYRRVQDLEDDPGAPRQAFVSTEASGDAQGALIGGLIGSVLAGLIGDRHAQGLQAQLDHGGLLLWVRTRDAAHERKALEVLEDAGASDVHVHGLMDKT